MQGPRVRMSYRKEPPRVQPIINKNGVRMLVPVNHRKFTISYKPDRISPRVHLDYLMAMVELKVKHFAGKRACFQFIVQKKKKKKKKKTLTSY